MANETGAWLENLRGRRQWSEAEARRVLEEWARSGMSLTAFARSAGLVAQRVSWWRKQLGIGRPGAERQPASSSATAFAPIVVRSTPVDSGRESAVVVTFGGVRMEVRDLDAPSAMWVAQVLRAAAEVPS